MRKLRIPVRAVFYREAGRWVAHCLEFDLAGDGETRPEAARNLSDAIACQIRASLDANNAANLFSPADPKLFEMFAAGKDVAHGECELNLQIDTVSVGNAELREYSDDENQPAMVSA